MAESQLSIGRVKSVVRESLQGHNLGAKDFSVTETDTTFDFILNFPKGLTLPQMLEILSSLKREDGFKNKHIVGETGHFYVSKRG